MNCRNDSSSSTKTVTRFYVTLPRTLEDQLQVSRSQAPNDIGIPCPLDDEPLLALPRSGMGRPMSLAQVRFSFYSRLPWFECFAKLTTPGMCFDAYFKPHGAGTNSQVTIHSCASQLDNSTRTLACKFLLDSVSGQSYLHIV